jgi:hypothetical protein
MTNTREEENKKRRYSELSQSCIPRRTPRPLDGFSFHVPCRSNLLEHASESYDDKQLIFFVASIQVIRLVKKVGRSINVIYCCGSKITRSPQDVPISPHLFRAESISGINFNGRHRFVGRSHLEDLKCSLPKTIQCQ